MTISARDIRAAAARIEGRVRRTPVLTLGYGAFGVDHDVRVTLKLELLQHTGSFKPRGAFNRMLSNDVPGAGVVAASGGNFGIAVAYAARELGHGAEVFLPDSTSSVKRERLRALGAEVRIVPGYYPEALAASEARVLETGALFMHAYDQPEIVAGAGTLGAELSAQIPDASTVLIAVGGGGLIGGVGAWYGGRTRVIGVESVACPCLSAALAGDGPVDVEVGGLAAEALGASRAGLIAYEIARRAVDRVVLVTDDAIRDAQRMVWDRVRLIAEPGGAAALAALTSGAYVPAAGDHVVVVVCGANTDPASVL
jgi:threonine dehydratase